jgi:hypothetical protein
MRAERVYTYSDPINDDFAGTNINTCRVGREFRFVRSSLLWRAVHSAVLSRRSRRAAAKVQMAPTTSVSAP